MNWKTDNPGLMTVKPDVPLRDVRISLRSRIFTKMLKWVLKPLIARFASGSRVKIAKTHLFIAQRPLTEKRSLGLKKHDRIINRVYGPTLGDFDNTNQRAILWFHGGGFLIPASEETHLRLVAHLCKGTEAVGFLPDYRLAPFNAFPAALDDCERAYLGLLELGFDPQKIWIGGDSAGGNLCLGTLQRLKKHGTPMPGVATLLSPVAEMGRIHAPRSRSWAPKRDPLIPIGSMGLMDDMYGQDWDASDPELSPMYGDYRGLPPMHFIAGETEVLLDESIFCAQRARDAGVESRIDVWPVLPHAFPLFEPLFRETAIVRQDMLDFATKYLA